ncbi:MAG TPA: LLM class flavin-dependent oxidoreductase, partial [Gaiellaceae bacterium]|nr:LLM class flavin-dependent oxidoreductase [Gaiellaceae bacterium]
MAVPFRIGVMQLTMEPLDEMIASARAMDGAGMDTIWLAEAYPWWRKHGMEARSSTVASALIAQATKRLTVGWGIISPFTRHPVQAAMDEAGMDTVWLAEAYPWWRKHGMEARSSTVVSALMARETERLTIG